MADAIFLFATNKADLGLNISATDKATGDDIDFTGATVSMVISSVGDRCYPRISASIGNYISQPSSTVLRLLIPASVMATLSPGSYQFDGNYTLNGATNNLFDGGTLTIRYSGAELP